MRRSSKYQPLFALRSKHPFDPHIGNMLEDWGWQFAYELTNNTCTRDSIPTYLPSAPSCLHANIRSAPALNQLGDGDLRARGPCSQCFAFPEVALAGRVFFLAQGCLSFRFPWQLRMLQQSGQKQQAYLAFLNSCGWLGDGVYIGTVKFFSVSMCLQPQRIN